MHFSWYLKDNDESIEQIYPWSVHNLGNATNAATTIKVREHVWLWPSSVLGYYLPAGEESLCIFFDQDRRGLISRLFYGVYSVISGELNL